MLRPERQIRNKLARLRWWAPWRIRRIIADVALEAQAAGENLVNAEGAAKEHWSQRRDAEHQLSIVKTNMNELLARRPSDPTAAVMQTPEYKGLKSRHDDLKMRLDTAQNSVENMREGWHNVHSELARLRKFDKIIMVVRHGVLPDKLGQEMIEKLARADNEPLIEDLIDKIRDFGAHVVTATIPRAETRQIALVQPSMSKEDLNELREVMRANQRDGDVLVIPERLEDRVELVTVQAHPADIQDVLNVERDFWESVKQENRVLRRVLEGQREYLNSIGVQTFQGMPLTSATTSIEPAAEPNNGPCYNLALSLHGHMTYELARRDIIGGLDAPEYQPDRKGYVYRLRGMKSEPIECFVTEWALAELKALEIADLAECLVVDMVREYRPK